ncbi:HicB family protein [cyanobacterium TDX16]|nr:HicB family protein [cyanobacterium TDX16]
MTLRYEITLYWSEEDKAFIAEVPELPGCAADGKSNRAALQNVEIMIQ